MHLSMFHNVTSHMHMNTTLQCKYATYSSGALQVCMHRYIYTYKIMPYDETIMADPLSNQSIVNWTSESPAVGVAHNVKVYNLRRVWWW